MSNNIETGKVYKGRVKNIAKYGVFVEIAPRTDGLLHFSNMPKERAQNFSTTMTPGQEISVEVLSHDPSTGRISLKLIE